MERLMPGAAIGYAVSVAVAMVTGAAAAAPSSWVAWTAESRALVAGGNAQRGQQLAERCASCHGAQGVSATPGYPHLAGQLATYIYKQLKDYRNGSRAQAMMAAFVANLEDQNMADLAAWYASLPLPTSDAPPVRDRAALSLVSKGDGRRLVPPCASCHGARGEGAVVDVPALAGQNAQYLETTLRAYQSGQRANDVYARMRAMSRQLRDEEIAELARYYETLSE